MKFKEVMQIIIENNEQKKGFMVRFDKIENGKEYFDSFPDKIGGEQLIESEELGWELADKFANATGNEYVNIYVLKNNYTPVDNYKDKMIRKYPQPIIKKHST